MFLRERLIRPATFFFSLKQMALHEMMLRHVTLCDTALFCSMLFCSVLLHLSARRVGFSSSNDQNLA